MIGFGLVYNCLRKWREILQLQRMVMQRQGNNDGMRQVIWFYFHFCGGSSRQKSTK